MSRSGRISRSRGSDRPAAVLGVERNLDVGDGDVDFQFGRAQPVHGGNRLRKSLELRDFRVCPPSHAGRRAPRGNNLRSSRVAKALIWAVVIIFLIGLAVVIGVFDFIF